MQIAYFNRLVLVFFFIQLFWVAKPVCLYAQLNYQLSASKDVPLLTGGIVGTATSLILKNQHDPLTATEIGRLNSFDISSFDRSAIENYSPSFKTASDITLFTAYAFPLVSLALPEARSDLLTLAVMMGEVVLLTETFTGITKVLVGRARPFTYNSEVPLDIRTENGNNRSYFSGHTSNAAALSFFAAKVIADHTDNQTVKTVVWTTAIVWPAATGYFRYRAGRHFPSDVITGYIAGAAIGWLVPHLHQVKSPKKNARVQLTQWQIGPASIRATIALQ